MTILTLCRPKPAPACRRVPGLVLLAGLLAFLISGCASAEDAGHGGRRFAFDPSGALFAGAFRDIGDYYIDKIPTEEIALAGLTGLDSASGDFSIQIGDRQILLLGHGKAVQHLPAPDPDDSDGWAAVLSAAITAGRAQSPELAKLDDEAVYQRIFDRITSKLDRFTRYAGAETARDQRASRDGFGGIGVTLDYTEKEPRVSSVIADGPAGRAGIRLDDRLVSIDHVAITTLNQRDVVDRLRGSIDSHVWLGIRRAGGAATLQIDVRRGLIVPPTITAERENGIAIFHVAVFNHNTADSLTEALVKARKELGRSLKGVVLDLRGNPGGLLDQAVDVASLFLDRGQVVSTRGRHPTAQQSFDAEDHDQIRGLPLVVLVNGGSASSSEIVAAALQDSGRAVLVGSSSYGKGTVQMVLTLENGGELTLTWAKLYTPGGYLLHEHGVVPSFCTSAPVDPLGAPQPPEAKLDQAIERGLHPAPGIESEPRAVLNQAGWNALRETCPKEARDNPLDLRLAERLIEDPKLYAHALAQPGVSVAHALGHAVGSALQ